MSISRDIHYAICMEDDEIFVDQDQSDSEEGETESEDPVNEFQFGR
jgi:hypothetical protein